MLRPPQIWRFLILMLICLGVTTAPADVSALDEATLATDGDPEEAQAFFAQQRTPAGSAAIPVERYDLATDQMRFMPLHSIASGGITYPSTGRVGIASTSLVLTPWTQLGPGNLGGRTLAVVIEPGAPTTMYAGTAGGGVWKTTDSGSHWSALSDPQTNLAVSALAISRNASVTTIYAGTGEGFFNNDALRGAGIFVSTNAGATWTRMASTANSSFYYVNKIAVSPLSSTVLYAATRAGLFRSMNAGTTWTNVVSAATIFDGCTDIAIANNSGHEQVVVSCGTISTAQGKVYRSVDRGPFSATLQAPGMERTSVAVAPSDPNVVYAVSSNSGFNTFNGFSARGGLLAVYRSTDGGQNWTLQRSGSDPGSDSGIGQLLFSDPTFAVGCLADVELINRGEFDNVIAVDPVNPNSVWVGGIDLFRSDDGGVTWGQASQRLYFTSTSYAHGDHHALVFHPQYDGAANQTIFVGTGGGIFTTTNSRGKTVTSIQGLPGICVAPNEPDTTLEPGFVRWTNLNHDYGATQFYHGLPFPGPNGGTTYIGGTQDNGTIVGTDAWGPNAWRFIYDIGGFVAVDATGTVVYLENSHLSLQKSTDTGSTFQSAVSGITEPSANFLFITPFTMSPTDSSQMWIGGTKLWHTTNATAVGPTTWSQASSDAATMGCTDVAADVAQFSAIAVAPAGDRVIAGTTLGCIFSTTSASTANSNTVWTLGTGVGLPAANVNHGAFGYLSGLAFDPANPNTVYATYSTFGVPHVWKSIDSGLHWTNIDGSAPTGIPDVPVNAIIVDPNNSANLFVGTDVGVFASTDGGLTWAVEHTGFANVSTRSFAIGQISGQNSLFAFTHGRGAWRVALPASPPRPPADLAVTQATVTPTAIAAGSSVVVTDTLKNLGGLPAGPFAVTFYLSTDAVLDGSDVLLNATQTVTLLTPSQTSTTGTSVPIPRGTPPGQYRIIVVADHDNVVRETTKANNVLATLPITVAATDVVATAASVLPTGTGAGLPLTVTYSVANHGAVSLGSLDVAFFLSTDGVLSGDDSPLLARTDAGLAPQGVRTSAANVTIPLTTPPGVYRIIAVVDPNNRINDTNPANNTAVTGPITIALADLSISSVTFAPGAVTPGMNITVTHVIRNLASAPGNAAPSLSSLGFGPPGGPTTPLGMINVPSIAAGGTATLTKSVTIPLGTPPGVYVVTVGANASGAVPEVGQANNTATAVARLIVGPDVTVTAATTAAGAAVGMNVSVSYTLKNQGGAAAGPFAVGFALVPTSDLSGASDIALAAVRNGVVLAPGASLALVNAVTVPANTGPGQYRIRVIADTGNAVVEADETNNALLTGVLNVVGPI